MSILTLIDGIPLYSTTTEAVKWAKARGLSGYHVHYFEGQKGYMGASDHSQFTQRSGGSATRRAVARRTTTTRQTNTSQRSSGSVTYTGGSSTGGGGGY
mgnify:CR=1 FL=1|jgi:hypothetical protein|tara:strand:+ start:328 stop:624 length:297 start_codon:yes stop_codon:yes gene_type:complete